jgi:hypothetical protein
MAQAIFPQSRDIRARSFLAEARKRPAVRYLRAERFVLCVLRTSLLVFAAYVGSLVVRDVTHELSMMTGRTPPAWTVR